MGEIIKWRRSKLAGKKYHTISYTNQISIMFALRNAATRTAARSTTARRFASTESPAANNNNNNTTLLVALAAAAAGGAYYYTKTDKGMYARLMIVENTAAANRLTYKLPC
jgi:hypothetical protein